MSLFEKSSAKTFFAWFVRTHHTDKSKFELSLHTFTNLKERKRKMSDFGIICEFNPIHNGHVRLIQKARELGAERVVCIMSGNAVQRGELSIADKYFRAEQAIKCGADLVLELPFPFSMSSAEFFAKSGVKIASEIGVVDYLVFGSESGDIRELSDIASIMSSTEYSRPTHSE
jgi:cytidyltransferase-like protein